MAECLMDGPCGQIRKKNSYDSESSVESSSSLSTCSPNNDKSAASSSSETTSQDSCEVALIVSPIPERQEIHYQRRSPRKSVPAPLALAAAAASVMYNSSGHMLTIPCPAISVPQTPTSPPDTPNRKDSKSKLFRFKVPPSLRILKKKRSCPSLFASNNNNLLGVPMSPRTAPLAEAEGCDWIRNPIDDCHSMSEVDDQGLMFNFPHSASSAPKSPSCPSFAFNSPSKGTRYKLLKETPPTQMCKLDHPRTMVGKLGSSKLLRRWETHILVLESDKISSTTPSGFMDSSIPFSVIEDVHIMPHFDGGDKYCLRVYIPEGSVLLQATHIYGRNQWLHSIQWKRYMLRFKRILESTNRPEVLLKEIKCMVEMALDSPLQDDSIFLEPVQFVCNVLKQIFDGNLPRNLLEPIVICVAPLLETVSAVAEICPWFSRHCQQSPRSRLVEDVFANVAHQTLKKNMDFGKFPAARTFVQSFLLALMAHNNGLEQVKDFVQKVHGPSSCCPHPRVLPNLVGSCLAAIHSVFDAANPNLVSDPVTNLALGDLIVKSKVKTVQDPEPERPTALPAPVIMDDQDKVKLECFCAVFDTMSEFDDWRQSLASILQPLPFPESAFNNEIFSKYFQNVVKRVGSDVRCDVHLSVLGVRQGKEGWFHLYCPGGPSCVDDGFVYAAMLKTLLKCCCKRKRFLQSLNRMLGPLQLLALRETDSAMEALCYMLELEVVGDEDMKIQMITALQSTSVGKRMYAELCDRQIALRELQQKGGPRKLTLPSKSTDGDLAVLLSSGSFGNLEWLSLAFTNVTSHCAEYLIKLPSLRYLNLWSTQFGDFGLQMITEHLHKLQVLNLCETPVTDKGLISLSALKNLRKLNMNSTKLSADTFQELRENLPALQEVDIRYTEAWCAEDLSPTSSR